MVYSELIASDSFPINIGIYIRNDKAKPYQCSKLSQLKNEKNRKFNISFRTSFMTYIILSPVCLLQVTFFNTIPVLQVYLNSLPNELRSRQPGLMEKSGVSWSEDLGVNPDFVPLEL